MGNSVSRVARSSLGSAQSTARQRPVDPAVAGQIAQIKEKEVAHVAALQAQKPLAKQDNYESELPTDDDGDQLQKLLRAIKTRPVDLYKNAKDSEILRRKRSTREEKEAALAGRLDSAAMRSAFEEALYMEQQRDGVINVKLLAQKYGTNENLLERTLRFCGLVVVEEAPDGRLVAVTDRKRWNTKFQ